MAALLNIDDMKLSFLLGALNDRPRLKRNTSERVRKNRQQAHLFCHRFSVLGGTVTVCPLLLVLLVLPPYFKLTAVC